jgi:exodeoxyribonuclease VII small subunit
MKHRCSFFPIFTLQIMAKKKTSVHFEAKLQQIRQIADRMQSENLNLDDSMALFREADGLIQECRAYLQQATVEVEMLIHPGSDETKPFA